MSAAKADDGRFDTAADDQPVTAVVVCGLPILSTSLKHQLQPAISLTAVVRPDQKPQDVVRQRQADVCILVTPLGPGFLRLIETVVAASPRTRVVVLSADDAPAAEVLNALSAGADGWLPLHIGATQLVKALKGVATGEASIPRRLMGDLLEEMRGTTTRRLMRPDGTRVHLSRREFEVLSGLAEGLSTSEVALQLGIGNATVRWYLASAVRRVGVPDRQAAVELMRSAS
ncbi:MAG: LuxR C-terminal-related transcriptional regulator [Actinomycetes bacterium]